MSFRRYLLFAFCITLLPQKGHSQEENKKHLSISHENDNLGGGTDRFYTSGVRATWFDSDITVPPVIDVMADRIPTFDLNERTSTFYSIGQNIYTPEDIRIAKQPKYDRPWAAFLYGSVGLATPTFSKNGDLHHVDELEFTLGVVGSEALGEPAQKFVHENISNSPEPKGWDNQIKFEPGVVISWQRRAPYFLETNIGSVNTRVEPNLSVSLGNIRTNISTGATLVIGSDRNLDTPPRVRPAVPGTGVFFTKDDTLNWQVFAGVDSRAVVRDIFLDGNSFTDSHSVDKKYFVGDLSTGVSLFYDDYRLSYTLNLRTKEFRAQDENSIFGSLTITKRF